MKKFTIAAPTPERLDYLAANLRAADVAELAALADISPRAALDVPGEKYVGLDEAGIPVGVFGLRDVGGGAALIWFLGTDEVHAYRRELLRCGRLAIKDWLTRYNFLCNIVHAENSRAIRLLKKWGFTVMPAVPMGPRGAMFHPFFITRS